MCRLRGVVPARRSAHGLFRVRLSPRRRLCPSRVRPDGGRVAGPLRQATRGAAFGGLATLRDERCLALPRARAPGPSGERHREQARGGDAASAGGALGEELSLARLFVKHEGENPPLSFKDRGMTAGVSWARACAFSTVAGGP